MMWDNGKKSTLLMGGCLFLSSKIREETAFVAEGQM